MNSNFIPPLLGAGIFLTLGILVLLSRPWTGARLGYFIFAMGTVWWQGWVAALFYSTNPHWSDLFARICYSGIIFLPISYYHYTLEFMFPGKFKKSILLHYGVGLAFLILLWSGNGLISGYRVFSWGRHPQAGSLHPLFLVYVWILVGRVIYLPYRERKVSEKNSLRDSQLRFLFWINIIYALAGIEFAINYGVQMYPVGVFFTLFSSCATAIAITKYSLFDLKSGLRQAIVFATSALFLCAPGLLVLYLSKSLLVGSLLLGVYCLFGSFWRDRFSSFLSAELDRLPLFKARHDHFARIQEQDLYLKQAQNLEDFCVYLNRAVTLAIGAEFAQTLFYKFEKNTYFNPLDPTFKTVSPNTPLLQALKRNSFLIRELIYGIIPSPKAGEIHAEMTAAQAEILFPLANDPRGPQALLWVGPKSQGRYDESDMAALWHVARLAEENLKLFLARESLLKKDRLAEVGERASVVGHELKTPLAIIQNSVFYLENQIANLPQVKNIHKHLAIIRGQTNSLQNIISDLLNYTRTRDLKLEPVDIHKYLTSLLEVFPHPNNILIEQSFSPEQAIIQADIQEFRQAFINLLNNAVEAMPQGGKLTIATAITQTDVAVLISDTGVGIEEKDLPRLFEPFYTTKSQGTGLGLAVVKKVMDRHRGNLEVQSQLGQGSTFTLKFPIDTK